MLNRIHDITAFAALFSIAVSIGMILTGVMLGNDGSLVLGSAVGALGILAALAWLITRVIETVRESRRPIIIKRASR